MRRAGKPTARRGASLLWSLLGLSLLCNGCAMQLAKMNTSAPIEKRPGFLAAAYYQDGERLDGSDMLDKLEREPGAADELSGRGALAFFGTFFGGIGGGLIGAPLGMAAAGNEDPPWLLAGIGAGLIVIGLPLAIMADAKVEAAVDRHNARFASDGRSAITEQRRAAETLRATPHGRALREVIDLADGIRLELLGEPARYGANVALRFSRVPRADGHSLQTCGQGTMRFGTTYQFLATPTHGPPPSGPAGRETLQTIVPFALFETMTEAAQVEFGLCDLTANLTDALMPTAKRFAFRFRHQLGPSVPSPSPEPEPEPVPEPVPDSPTTEAPTTEPPTPTTEAPTTEPPTPTTDPDPETPSAPAEQ